MVSAWALSRSVGPGASGAGAGRAYGHFLAWRRPPGGLRAFACVRGCHDKGVTLGKNLPASGRPSRTLADTGGRCDPEQRLSAGIAVSNGGPGEQDRRSSHMYNLPIVRSQPELGRPCTPHIHKLPRSTRREPNGRLYMCRVGGGAGWAGLPRTYTPGGARRQGTCAVPVRDVPLVPDPGHLHLGAPAIVRPTSTQLFAAASVSCISAHGSRQGRPTRGNRCPSGARPSAPGGEGPSQGLRRRRVLGRPSAHVFP